MQISGVVAGGMELPQPLGEGIRADGLPVRIGELDYSVFFDRMSISEGRREAVCESADIRYNDVLCLPNRKLEV